MTIQQPFNTIPPHLLTLADYQQQAQKHMPDSHWAYLESGAMHEVSLKDNQQQFDKIHIRPRVLKDLSGGNTQFEMFGQSYPHPIFLAPIGHQALFHPDAELATALAAEVLQSNLILSTFTTTDLRALNADNPFKWFQLYWQGGHEKSLQLVKLSEQHHYKAIVITVDSPHKGIRDTERKANFQLPPDMPHPHTKTFLMAENLSPEQHPVFDGLMQLAPTWQDIAWLAQQTALPIVLKGVSHPDDAKLAMEHGVKGLIISNHGGRVLDTCISPLTALERIKAVVPHDYPLLIDGGIRRGTDVFKAIALGAHAVLIGRPYIYGLATAGALGVAHVIRTLKEEFEITMALAGTARISDISMAHIEVQSH
ncbi:alpha-hydroxy acid oxidase [Acinetobacter rathckeae]|uniref:alpha-hydroxy acid oxidase n=1 Tax=Acinetobacter rathckeae TaxID=2605272 RepID=UPI0018A28990|nr:alpha-hydroxy acid oxidase [Acinetobacter rathckeae]MBF7688873.1 alpha-hydroxy-acid oxidizing protein [Acinetobacter rathckeae]